LNFVWPLYWREQIFINVIVTHDISPQVQKLFGRIIKTAIFSQSTFLASSQNDYFSYFFIYFISDKSDILLSRRIQEEKNEILLKNPIYNTLNSSSFKTVLFQMLPIPLHIPFTLYFIYGSYHPCYKCISSWNTHCIRNNRTANVQRTLRHCAKCQSFRSSKQLVITLEEHERQTERKRKTGWWRERNIRVITKLPNSEQSYKGKVKTHNYINRQNQSTTGKLWKP
jgi:hypothetical protein